MTNSRYENMWHVLRQREFEILNENSRNYQCTICNRILVNATNGPCGCRYCHECIDGYLKSEEGGQLCPGETRECREERLEMRVNVLVDQAANKLVSRARVMCPEPGCGFEDELARIGDHLRACESANRPTCPYKRIGCHGDGSMKDEAALEAHLARYCCSHAIIQLDWIENRFNEIEYRKIESEKTIFDKIDQTNVIQKGDIDSVKECLDNLKSVIDQLKQDVSRLKRESDEKQSIIIHLQRRDSEKTQQIDELKRRLVEIQSIKDNDERNKEKEKLISLKIESKSLTEFKHQIDTKLGSLTVQIDSMESILSVVNYGEFVWKIDNFSTKCHKSELGLDTEIHSPGFYSHRNGYRLCLCAYPSGGGVGEGTHLSLGFTILRGEFDDLLPWPMKHEVMFCLIDQHSGSVYRTATGNYLSTPIDNRCVFHRPESDKNMCLSRPRFISLSELFTNRNLLRNDTIIVKCVVNL